MQISQLICIHFESKNPGIKAIIFLCPLAKGPDKMFRVWHILSMSVPMFTSLFDIKNSIGSKARTFLAYFQYWEKSAKFLELSESEFAR